jgi:hypothetical protein
MRRLSFAALILLVPFTAYVLTGCGGSGTKKGSGGSAKSTESTEEEGAKTALETAGTATLKGRVTLEGPLPMPKPLPDLVKHKDCHDSPKEQQIDQTWVVSEDRGVRDVVVWVQPPSGKFFKLTKEEATPKEKVVKLEQPHCQFIPHVLVLFPGYYDGSKTVETGQKLEVVNNATFSHNTNIQGDPLINPNWNQQLTPGKTHDLALKPQPQVINVKCDIHAWMRAKIWALDTPFSAKTDKDGNYKIENVPAGAKVSVVAWHEELPGEGFALPEFSGSADGQEVTFEKGKTRELNFKIKRK